jgi:hypothetical protein
MGTIYSKTNHKVDVSYLNKALVLFKKNKFYKGNPTCYINIAQCYWKKYKESIALYNQSITVLALHNDYTMAVN